MQESDDEADLDVFGMNWGLGEGGPKGLIEGWMNGAVHEVLCLF